MFLRGVGLLALQTKLIQFKRKVLSVLDTQVINVEGLGEREGLVQH